MSAVEEIAVEERRTVEEIAQLANGFRLLSFQQQKERVSLIKTPELLTTFLRVLDRRSREFFIDTWFDSFFRSYQIEMIAPFFAHIDLSTFAKGHDGRGYLFSELMEEGAVDVTTFLLDHGLSPNVPDSNPMLHGACAHEKVDLIDLLIERGADVNKRDYKGETAAFEAVRCKDVRILDRLIMAGADLRVTNDEGESIWLNAFFSFNEAIIQRLAQMKVSIENNFFKTIDKLSKGNLFVETKIDRFINTLSDNGHLLPEELLH